MANDHNVKMILFWLYMCISFKIVVGILFEV